MQVKSIEINHFRAYTASGPIKLGQITVLTGANNVGKSTILKALHYLQSGSGVTHQDVRLGADAFVLRYSLQDPHTRLNCSAVVESILTVSLLATPGQPPSRTMVVDNSSQQNVSEIQSVEPLHYILPFLSNRKTSGYNEDTRAQHTTQIAATFHNLPAKISRLSNSTYPAHVAYKEACERILGYPVFTVPSSGGNQVGMYVGKDNTLSLSQMGDGVPHIVGLLADLAVAEDKLFLI